jgi:hypothetical protein
MKIDYLELKKICIAQTSLDPHLLWNAFSDFTKKRVQKMLSEVADRNVGNPQAIEQGVVDLIRKTSMEGPRRRRTVFLLLMMAKNQGLISSSVYKQLREEMGVTDYSPEIEKELAPPPQKQEDIFDILSGKSLLNNTVDFSQQEKITDSGIIKK